MLYFIIDHDDTMLVYVSYLLPSYEDTRRHVASHSQVFNPMKNIIIIIKLSHLLKQKLIFKHGVKAGIHVFGMSW